MQVHGLGNSRRQVQAVVFLVNPYVNQSGQQGFFRRQKGPGDTQLANEAHLIPINPINEGVC